MVDQYFIHVIALNMPLAVENPVLSPTLLSQKQRKNYEIYLNFVLIYKYIYVQLFM